LLGAHKDECLIHGAGTQQVDQQRHLARFSHRVHLVGDGVRNAIALGDFNVFGVLQHGIGQPLDFGREGGREQQTLPRLRQHIENALDIGNKAHIQHAVRLIQNQRLDGMQADGFLFHQIQEAAGRCHEKFDAQFQFGDLGFDIGAAIHTGDAVGQVFTVGFQVVVHLNRQLAGGCQHQGAHRVFGRRGAAVGMRQQSLQ